MWGPEILHGPNNSLRFYTHMYIYNYHERERDFLHNQFNFMDHFLIFLTFRNKILTVFK